ncbi:hypothetical protein LMG31506_03339 [Cupriavidus yeoncheonensis]|uniref:O-antigen ligase domain-containing protein n=1 Tax=Cupriavidus yeoncheonensis TaxID=1462994 RepID=A0A916IWJ2_9BURK|nr:hypothetical protein [Cupriavidus yeoncheonensis]CAG2146164.1 hypothetical protein LMG31506_03339 [Cupriavidus yeoncheonensis]
MFKILLLLGSIVLFFLSVVIPNSMQNATAACLVLCAVFALPNIRLNRNFQLLLSLYLLSCAVTVFYILVGLSAGAVQEAVQQTVIIYILSPLLWILIVSGLTNLLDDEAFRRWIMVFMMLCVSTVPLFFYLFLQGYDDAVHFFIKEANVDLTEGNVAATIHVYGSFIFLSGGMFAAPGLVRGNAARVLVLSALAAVAITSGRSALMISIPTGVLLGLVLNSRMAPSAASPRSARGFRSVLQTGLVICAILLAMAMTLDDISLPYIFSNMVEKLTSGGGPARAEQFNALMDGVARHWALGSGHGIGVNYLRNDDYPWRYELVWVATILRVGVIGSLIYLLPFLTYVVVFLRRWSARRLSELDIFFFAGFVTAFLASNTNPYVEAFTFQWMYILPTAHLLNRGSARNGARQ